jgi:signal transduction histidine kinase
MSTWHTRSRLDLGRGNGTTAAATGTTVATILPATASFTDAAPSRRSRARRRSDRRAGDRRATPERTSEVSLSQETRRVAADVHDLVMQDLCLALASARQLEDDPDVALRASVVVTAAERALAGAREVLDSLSGRSRRPIAEAVEESVEAAARATPFTFDATMAPSDMEPDQATFDALVHTGREAVTNAVKHGQASAVMVVLEYRDEWHLRIADNGRGFDPAEQSTGFGLESLSRHAQALGGRVVVTSGPGRGTIVSARLP